ESVNESAYAATLRQTVADVVRKQAEAGIDVPSDGEYGKSGWFTCLIERTSGFEVRDVPRPSATFLGAEREGRFAPYYDPLARAGEVPSACVSRRLLAGGPA